jgi:hypothetical protein
MLFFVVAALLAAANANSAHCEVGQAYEVDFLTNPLLTSPTKEQCDMLNGDHDKGGDHKRAAANVVVAKSAEEHHFMGRDETNLNAANVTASLDYPNDGTPFANGTFGTPPTPVPTGDLTILANQYTINITATRITFSFTGAPGTNRFRPGFNGPVVVVDSGAPAIVGAVIDGATSADWNSANVTFTDTKVSINLASLAINQGDKIIVDLTFATTTTTTTTTTSTTSTTTPEPTSTTTPEPTTTIGTE